MRSTRFPPHLWVCQLLVVALAQVALASAPEGERDRRDLPDDATLRAWIQGFKEDPKGPFENIRWFCEDGTVLPPRPYACKDHGGGLQHGALNERAKRLRAGGFEVANLLVDLEPEQFTGAEADLDLLKLILLERFLIGWDDGWIFRGARSYRGAFQIEDEEAAAQEIVLAILADPAWRESARFALLREVVRLMPLQSDAASAADVRQRALLAAEKDASFTPLRAKIHNVPDASDAEKVREYANTRGKPAMKQELLELADAIDALYASEGAIEAVQTLAGHVSDPDLANTLQTEGAKLGDGSAVRGLVAAGKLLAAIRDAFPSIVGAETALSAIQTSLALENEVYTRGNQLLLKLDGYTRRQRLWLLIYTGEALYGSGFITRRHLAEIDASSARLEETRTPTVNAYRDELRLLARAPEWSGRWLEFHFGPTVEQLSLIEPEAHLYSQDRVRGSPLLFYTAVIDSLVLDANRLAGIEHDFFGKRIGAGLRALNPGLTRGNLAVVEEGAEIDRNGIYLLPETTADLPRVAGILTQGEGNSLSHVQLLARNLGIPNVVVGDALLPEVRRRLGDRAVLAVSPNGVVQLVEYGPQWDGIFGEEAAQATELVIRPDLEKLDIEATDLIPLSMLRASDSGRTSGPKGANLGELKFAFGDTVPPGFVIPFGMFRHILDQPLEAGGPPVFDWMKERYAAIAAESDQEKRQRMVSVFLLRLREWIENVEFPSDFEQALRAQLLSTFGPDGTYGVFVRSDTNVEDLPGFTGAGLNLTLFNVVGTDNIIQAIKEVWASPFTERAYGWRQENMETPELVFPAVVVQQALRSEKSGVMVTADVESGELGWLSVAVSEGVGGAVEGQATESLRINTDTGEVRFLAQATAPSRTSLLPEGGTARVPSSGTDAVLSAGEIAQLVELARQVPTRFPSLRDEATGEPLPADIEFAFLGGKLALLQMRPFVESGQAQSSSYLRSLDAGLLQRGQAPVALDEVPAAATRGAS